MSSDQENEDYWHHSREGASTFERLVLFGLWIIIRKLYDQDFSRDVANDFADEAREHVDDLGGQTATHRSDHRWMFTRMH